MTNLADEDMTLYYQINYTLTEVPEDAAYFHAQFRRVNPLPYKEVYTILDGVKGGGTTWAPTWRGASNNNGWWGEGEDQVLSRRRRGVPDDLRHRHRGLLLRLLQLRPQPEAQPRLRAPTPRPTPGSTRSSVPTTDYQTQQRFGLYRWHITDPIRFETDLKVTHPGT